MEAEEFINYSKINKYSPYRSTRWIVEIQALLTFKNKMAPIVCNDLKATLIKP